jgi:cytochrome d ubiquinol oxidase subunit II
VNLANVLAAVMWLGVTLYVLFGGADFGAGFWDLVAGGPQRGDRPRRLIEHSIGPVWEANHVWLIFILVVMWTAFPRLFGAVFSTLWIPLSVATVGIIARGSAFAFRKTVTATWQRRLFGASFAASSVITPFFLGVVAGSVAGGRVPSKVGTGGEISSWWNPTAIMVGVFSVVVCAYLAAVYLTADARRGGEGALVTYFRTRAAIAGVVAGAVAGIGLIFLHRDVPVLAHGLAHRALALVVLSALAGIAAFILLLVSRFLFARVAAGLAVTAVVWAWAVAQYPHLLDPGLTVAAAAATPSVLKATVISLAVGAVLLVPSLVWLYVLFQRPLPEQSSSEPPGVRTNQREGTHP